MAVTNNLLHNKNLKALSIQINLSGLSFCVLNKDDNTITALKTVTFKNSKNPENLLEEVKTLFNTTAELQTTFTEVIVLHQNNWSTLVPLPIFKKEHIADYLKFNTKILPSDLLDYDSLNHLDTCCVYVPFTNINNYIFDKFGSFTFKHTTTVLVENLAILEKNNDIKKVYLNFNLNHFDLVIFNSGKLIFYNNFEVETPEDFLYYVLFTFEQLNINPELVKTSLLGHINTTNAFYKMAYKYIRFVDVLETNYAIAFQTNTTEKQRYFNLIHALI